SHCSITRSQRARKVSVCSALRSVAAGERNERSLSATADRIGGPFLTGMCFAPLLVPATAVDELGEDDLVAPRPHRVVHENNINATVNARKVERACPRRFLLPPRDPPAL